MNHRTPALGAYIIDNSSADGARHCFFRCFELTLLPKDLFRRQPGHTIRFFYISLWWRCARNGVKAIAVLENRSSEKIVLHAGDGPPCGDRKALQFGPKRGWFFQAIEASPRTGVMLDEDHIDSVPNERLARFRKSAQRNKREASSFKDGR